MACLKLFPKLFASFPDSGLLQAAFEVYRAQQSPPSSHAAKNWKSLGSLVGSLKCEGRDSQLLILKSLLCYAIGQFCDKRSTYIERIMVLNKKVQERLMQLIKEGTASKNEHSYSFSHPDESYLDDLGIDEDNESLLDNEFDDQEKENTAASPFISSSKNNSSFRSPLSTNQSPLATYTNRLSNSFSKDWRRQSFASTSGTPKNDHMKLVALQNEISNLKQSNKNLGNQIQEMQGKEVELMSRMEQKEALHRAELLKTESEALSKATDMQEDYEAKISDLKHSLVKATKTAEETVMAKEQVASLKDEVDVLQHSNARLLPMEEQLQRMKIKLEHLSDVSEILSREEKAHSESVSKCLELEKELAILQPLKRQLKEYKSRAADAEVRFVDYEREISKLKEAGVKFSEINREIKDCSIRQQAESEDLRRRLEAECTDSRDHDLSGVGGGISELNPELKEELLRLRSENLRLKKFAAKREVDSVQKMEEKLEDVGRLSTRFQDQYLSTKNTLDDVTDQLQEGLSREKNLKENLAIAEGKCTQLENVLKTECRTFKEKILEAETTIQSTKRDMTQEFREKCGLIEKEWEAKVAKERTDGEMKYNQLVEEKKLLEIDYEKKISDIQYESESTLQSQREKGSKELDCLKSEHEKKLEEVALKSRTEREELIAKGKQMLKTKEEGHTKILQEEQERRQNEIFDLSEKIEKENEEHRDYSQRLISKLESYREKLKIKKVQVSDISSEYDESQTRCKKLEREKSELEEENDRYRRQLGSRFGSEKGQTDELQKEYSALLKENRLLKKAENDLNTKFTCNPFLLPSNLNGSDNEALPQSFSGVSHSSLTQLREEYEDRINKINDEKRELVMKNSAAMTDVQKVQQRSWDLEVEVKNLQSEKTSLALQLERLERHASSGHVLLYNTQHSPCENNRSPIQTGKRLASKLSPKVLAEKASDAWKRRKSTKLSFQVSPRNDGHDHSPKDSIAPRLDIKSPEFVRSIERFKSTSVDKFKKRLTNRLGRGEICSPPSRTLAMMDFNKSNDFDEVNPDNCNQS